MLVTAAHASQRLNELPRADSETDPNWFCGFSGRHMKWLESCAKYEHEPGSDDQ